MAHQRGSGSFSCVLRQCMGLLGRACCRCCSAIPGCRRLCFINYFTNLLVQSAPRNWGSGGSRGAPGGRPPLESSACTSSPASRDTPPRVLHGSGGERSQPCNEAAGAMQGLRPHKRGWQVDGSGRRRAGRQAGRRAGGAVDRQYVCSPCQRLHRLVQRSLQLLPQRRIRQQGRHLCRERGSGWAACSLRAAKWQVGLAATDGLRGAAHGGVCAAAACWSRL